MITSVVFSKYKNELVINVVMNVLSQTDLGTWNQTLHIMLLMMKGKYSVFQRITRIARIN